jgi:hypothetical protein
MTAPECEHRAGTASWPDKPHTSHTAANKQPPVMDRREAGLCHVTYTLLVTTTDRSDILSLATPNYRDSAMPLLLEVRYLDPEEDQR